MVQADLPVIAGYIISLRPSYYRNFQFPDKLNNILPESILISKRGGRIIYAVIYNGTNGFNKRTMHIIFDSYRSSC